MAKIRFWKWQHTDELGMPRPTRFPLTDVEREDAEPPELHPRSLETWNLERARSNIAPSARPK